MNTQRFKAILEYDGSKFYGMQRQNSVKTVQCTIEQSLSIICGTEIKIDFSGRTDAGVHALGQVIHFDISNETIQNKKLNAFKIKNGINFFGKTHGLSIIDCVTVDGAFHSRFSAKQRVYLYKICVRESPSPIDESRKWVIHKSIDVQKLEQCTKYLIGNHNFESFRSTGCNAKSPIKTIDFIEIKTTCKNKYSTNIYIEIGARSFLYNMVRNIVGTLVHISSKQNINPEYISQILEAKDRSKAFQTAPAHGLYLKEIIY